MTLLESVDESFVPAPNNAQAEIHTRLCAEEFQRMIALERKRTERSGRPFLLMLLDAGKCENSEAMREALQSVLSMLHVSTRETDVIGWYKDGVIAGVIFTGLVANEKNAALRVISEKINNALLGLLTSEQLSQLVVSYHFFPDEWDHNIPGPPGDEALYPDLMNSKADRRPITAIKRLMDVVGSAIILLLCSPLLILIAIAIKISSRGPVIFRQQRVGQHGQCFTFLKFRSMYVNNDPRVHQEYVAKLIAGEAECEIANGTTVYKLASDKRITRVGKYLRRSSLDELPQLFNVLCGDMSLVGPRPAIPYEVATYQLWHRRRVLNVKPGITGLWQVSGRNRISFDEMVRLDLQYATSWSPWLDIKILIRTPQAVFKGAC